MKIIFDSMGVLWKKKVSGGGKENGTDSLNWVFWDNISEVIWPVTHRRVQRR